MDNEYFERCTERFAQEVEDAVTNAIERRDTVLAFLDNIPIIPCAERMWLYGTTIEYNMPYSKDMIRQSREALGRGWKCTRSSELTADSSVVERVYVREDEEERKTYPRVEFRFETRHEEATCKLVPTGQYEYVEREIMKVVCD